VPTVYGGSASGSSSSSCGVEITTGVVVGVGGVETDHHHLLSLLLPLRDDLPQSVTCAATAKTAVIFPLSAA
jgi:hypothetical protein